MQAVVAALTSMRAGTDDWLDVLDRADTETMAIAALSALQALIEAAEQVMGAGFFEAYLAKMGLAAA